MVIVRLDKVKSYSERGLVQYILKFGCKSSKKKKTKLKTK